MLHLKICDVLIFRYDCYYPWIEKSCDVLIYSCIIVYLNSNCECWYHVHQHEWCKLGYMTGNARPKLKLVYTLTIALVLFSWILPTLTFAPILHYFLLFRSLFQKCFSLGGWCYSQKVWFPFCLFFEHVNYPGAANMIFMALKQFFGMI